MKRPVLWLVFAVLTLPNRSIAQTNSPDSQPATGGIARLTGEPPVLVQVTNAPVSAIFMAYTPGGQNSYAPAGRNFQLNFLTTSRTHVVSEVGEDIGGDFSRTGYTLKKFEQKKIPATDGAPGGKEVSELTLQREGEEPIVLVLGETNVLRQLVVRIVCPGSTEEQTVRRSQ